jgi:formylglycine-generating enzyme required for sulfatase activity
MSESCCKTLPVTAGKYYRTYGFSDAGVATAESDLADVSGFELDKYPVTVGRFLQYVSYLAADGGAPPAPGTGKHTHLNGGSGLVAEPGGGFETGWDSAWDSNIPTGVATAPTWTEQLAQCAEATWGLSTDAGTQATLPVNCINWYQAYAFCIWDGGFLPTEAEWELAAGGNLQVPYPWGDATPEPITTSYAVVECDYASAPGCGVNGIAPVGSAPSGVGPFGQLDLLGEVQEWTLDTFAPAYPLPCDDCAELSATIDLRVPRGVAWSTALQPVTTRSEEPAATSTATLGVRCARPPAN